MRYLPVRPDLMDAVRTLAKEGDWDYQYNVRAGEDLKPGDVVVVELGGMVDRATFLGDVTGLGMETAGATGVIVDGGISASLSSYRRLVVCRRRRQRAGAVDTKAV